MKEYYPYTVVPFSVEKIRSEGIPAPRLPKLMLLPAPVRRRYTGTVIFIISFAAFIIFSVFVKLHVAVPFISFFIALISLVATIFEFVQHGQLQKQYKRDYELYLEHKEIYKKLKSEQEKVNLQNKDEKLVKEYQKEKVKEFFKTSYDVIIAVHNEYSPAKKRFKLFLDEYFPDEILENVKVVHESKKLEYIPDFVIKFDSPKLNVAIEIEEPYTLSNVPENIQKDYEAKDRIRQRFANEMGWIVIVLSEEQAVISPTECCKFVEESIELLYGDIKSDEKFVNIKTIKKQKMLTGDERANLKNSKYREKYLTEAGLWDNPSSFNEEYSKAEPEIKKELVDANDLKVQTNNRNGKIQEEVVELIANSDTSKLNETQNVLKNSDTRKNEIENEQMLLIKKMAQKVKIISDSDDNKVLEQDPIIFKTDDSLEIEQTETKQDELIDRELIRAIEEKLKQEQQMDLIQHIEEKVKEEITIELVHEGEEKIIEEHPIELVQKLEEKIIEEIPVDSVQEFDDKTFVESTIESVHDDEPKLEMETKEEIGDKEDPLSKEEDILKDLYSALDKHSRKQRERKDKRLRDKVISNGEHTHSKGLTDDEQSEEIVEEQLEPIEIKKVPILEMNQQDDVHVVNEIISEAKFDGDFEKELVENNQANQIEEPIVKEIFEETQVVNLIEQIEEEKLVVAEISEILTEKLEPQIIETILDEKKELIIETSNVQELIDTYREKIEGAVFDKSWDELIDLCNSAIEEIPQWDWAYYRRSTAWGNKKDFEKVIEDCTAAVGINPNLADAYYNRGTARFFLKKYKDASEDYQKSIDLNYVKKADAHFNRGLCFQKLDHEKAAYLEFVKAKELGSPKAIDFIKKEYQGEE